MPLCTNFKILCSLATRYSIYELLAVLWINYKGEINPIYLFRQLLTEDQSVVTHSLVPGQGTFSLHLSASAGFSSSSHAVSSRAICSSFPRLLTHITVRRWIPSLPHVTEQCCHGPVHHLKKNFLDFN